MKSNLVSKSETASILSELQREWGAVGVPRVKNLMVHQIEPGAEIIVGGGGGGGNDGGGGGLVILHIGGRYVPFLTQERLLGEFPSVTVDMGAVRFMCNGANVMRPGIRAHTEFQAGQVVCVVEESKGKFLAVGTASVSSTKAESMQRGEVVKNIHHVSDRFWEAGKTIKGV